MTNADQIIFVHLSSDFLDAEFDFKNQFLDFDESPEAIERRVYIKLCLDDLFFLIPLRRSISNLTGNSALKGCFFEAPSSSRPNGGLDFTKAVLVEEGDILECKGEIAHSQKQKIVSEYVQIESMYRNYYEGFKKSLKKDRTGRDQKFKFCVLRSFENKIRCKIN